MFRPTILSLALLLLAAACAPLIELEDENIALRSRVDSLEIELAECRGQGELLIERLSVIEAQNISLDDRNRELAANLAEARSGSDPATTGSDTDPADTDATGADVTDAGVADAGVADAGMADAGIRDAGSAEAGAVVATGAGPELRFAAGVPADLEFLRRYQSALSAFNEKRHAEAARMFSALLSGGQRNDMIDNCLYWLGEAELRNGNAAEAIRHFTGTISCAGGDKVDDALLARASAYRAAGNIAAARADVQRLLREHPQSELAGQARSMLRGMP